MHDDHHLKFDLFRRWFIDERLPTLLAHASTRSCSVDKEPIDAVIGLGSSCFARGNAEKLRALKACPEHHNDAVNFQTKGSLCVKEFTAIRNCGRPAPTSTPETEAQC